MDLTQASQGSLLLSNQQQDCQDCRCKAGLCDVWERPRRGSPPGQGLQHHPASGSWTGAAPGLQLPPDLPGFAFCLAVQSSSPALQPAGSVYLCYSMFSASVFNKEPRPVSQGGWFCLLFTPLSPSSHSFLSPTFFQDSLSSLFPPTYCPS